MKKRKNKTLELNEQLTPNTPPPDKSPIIPQRSKLRTSLDIFQRSATPRQRQFLDLALNKDAKLIFVSGPAGTAKTFWSVYAALTLMNEKRISDLIYVRSIVESADKSMGFLPGGLDEKMSPYLEPLVDKLEEFLPRNQIELLNKEKRITGIPVGHLRGRNFNAKVIIGDEAQNMTWKEWVAVHN